MHSRYICKDGQFLLYEYRGHTLRIPTKPQEPGNTTSDRLYAEMQKIDQQLNLSQSYKKFLTNWY